MRTPKAAKRTKAVVVAIEEYRKSAGPGIAPVKYALNDANLFQKVLRDKFKVSDDDIMTFQNQDATKTTLENDIRYLASTLGEDERFIFYYAGHGFHDANGNRLTAWDSNP